MALVAGWEHTVLLDSAPDVLVAAADLDLGTCLEVYAAECQNAGFEVYVV